MEWPEPKEGCDLKFIPAVVEVACRNQWTAKGIVKRAIDTSHINLINALLNEDCSSLKPHRKELSDAF